MGGGGREGAGIHREGGLVGCWGGMGGEEQGFHFVGFIVYGA